MATDSALYSLKQFKVAIQKEGTLGTANTTSMQLVNIDDWPGVSYNPYRHLEVRHGDGRIAKAADIYVSQYGQPKTISISGFYDQTVVPALLENCTGTTAGSGPASYAIPYNYTGPECHDGDTDTDWTGAITVALISPETGKTIIAPGCFVNRLKVSATAGEEGGRFKFEAELVTRYNFSFNQSAPTGMSAYPSTYRTLYDLATKRSLAGVDVDLYKLEFEIVSNVNFAGYGADGIPSVIARGVPEIQATATLGIKYDSASAIRSYNVSSGGLSVELSNNTLWASATFGLKGVGYVNADFDITDVEGGAFFDLPLKFLAPSAGNAVEFIP